MLTVKIANYIQVAGLPKKLEEHIKKELTTINPVYSNAKKFSRRPPKGTNKDIKTWKMKGKSFLFSRGYLDDLKQLLHDNNIEYKIEFNTVKHKPQYPPKLPKLYDHQQRFTTSLLKSFQGLGESPAGSGKTIMMLYVYAKLGQKCLWITHTKRLAYQAIKRAKEFLDIDAGLIGDGIEDIKHFTVGIVATLCKRDLKKLGEEFGLIIIDESQRIPADSFLEVVSSFRAHYRYTVTATPYRGDGLEEIIFQTIGPKIAYLGRKELRQLGYLMTPTVILRPTKFTFDYNPYDRKKNYIALERALTKSNIRNNQILSDIIVEATYADNISIVLARHIPHIEYLYKELVRTITNVGIVHSKMKVKLADEMMDSFESGEFKVLFATYKMLGEGFDYKPANRLFLVGAMKDRTAIEQAGGRIERVCEGKYDAFIFDYVDMKVSVLKRQALERREIHINKDDNVIVDDRVIHRSSSGQ